MHPDRSARCDALAPMVERWYTANCDEGRQHTAGSRREDGGMTAESDNQRAEQEVIACIDALLSYIIDHLHIRLGKGGKK